jgi:hypothetical protein
MQQWADVLDHVKVNGDVEDPFDCMGRYELALRARGITTLLGKVVGEMQEAFRKAGVPEEYVSNAVELFVRRNLGKSMTH